MLPHAVLSVSFRAVKRLIFLIVLITAINFLTMRYRVLMHIVKYRDIAVSWAKMAELIKMQFWTLIRVGPENVRYMSCRFLQEKRHFGVCGSLKSIVKRTILGVG